MDQTLLFNAALRTLRRDRALRSQGDGFLFHEGAEALADRLGFIRRRFEAAVFHGDDFGALAAAAIGGLDGAPALAELSETWAYAPESLDLIVSNLQLHWVNDLPGMLVQMRRTLKPDGHLSACLVGGESLFELRAVLMEAEARLGLAASPRISPMIDLPTATGLMQRAGFALPVVDHEVVRLAYAHPLKLMHDLRNLGQANAIFGQRKTFDFKEFWPTVCAVYEELFPHQEGGVAATFDLIFLSGWAPAPTQQQPLKPGSAKLALAEALK